MSERESERERARERERESEREILIILTHQTKGNNRQTRDTATKA